MENLYEILKCAETADYSALKKAYSELALKSHPDKVGQNDPKSTEKFNRINKAWKILSDPDLRKEFDVRWRERCLAQVYPIQDTVDFEEFEQEEENEDSGPTNNQVKDFNCDRTGADGDVVSSEDSRQVHDSGCVYKYSCRCGGKYVLTETDVCLKFDFVCCDSCSLTVQVVYSEEESVT